MTLKLLACKASVDSNCSGSALILVVGASKHADVSNPGVGHMQYLITVTGWLTTSAED